MKTHNHNHNQLIELVNDGSLNDLLSTEFCTLLRESFSAEKAVAISSMGKSDPLVNFCGIDDQHVKLYEDYFYQLDPMLNCKTQDGVLRMSDVVSKQCFESSEFYNDFYKKMDSYHSLAVARPINLDTSIEIAVNRGKESSDFTIAEKHRIKRIMNMFTARVGILTAAENVSKSYRHEKLNQIATISERELELFLHITTVGSLTSFQQAHNISQNTARSLLKSLRAKLHAENQIELVKIAQAIL